MGYANQYLCDENCTIIGRKGTINKPLYPNVKFWNIDTAFGISPFGINARFLFHSLKNFNFLTIMVGSARPSLVKSDLLKIKIPLPPLAEQERIVNILDKFDTLVNDISQGLPAEIEARQKQYEYYRDKLFTFKEKEIQ